ncbi:MAG: hypothetical protein P8L44_21640 [Opitutales bacterium]|nr:hypothetical protein [Opitutales bacterium]
MGPWERIRLAMEELGPTFVKMGQVLSTRTDSLPAPMIESLKQLRDRVKPESIETIRTVLESQLGTDIENVFQNLMRNPSVVVLLLRCIERCLLRQVRRLR